MASFQRTLDDCHSAARALEASVAAMWQGIFSARFRDVDADIRAVVIRGVGDWIALNPADFLTDAYLKYVAWALSDRVRMSAPSAVPLITHNGNVLSLYFTHGYRAATK